MAWLLKIETDSILIKEKRKHLSKMSDRVSKMLQRKRLKFGCFTWVSYKWPQLARVFLPGANVIKLFSILLSISFVCLIN